MSKKGSDAPAAPNPSATIAAQSAANKDAIAQSAKVNAVDIINPYGSTTYERNPDGTPKTQITSLNPQGQQILEGQMDIAQDLTGRAQTAINNVSTDGFSLSGLNYNPKDYGSDLIADYQVGDKPYDPRSYGDLNMYQAEASDAAFNQAMSRIAPAQAQEFDRRTQWLNDQGLPVGGEAHNKALAEMQRGQNDAVQSAANNAVMIGGQEAQRRMDMERGLRGDAQKEDLANHQQTSADQTNEISTQQNLRNQQLQELLLERTQNFNEASAYLTGAPALGTPNAPNMPTYNMQAPDVIGATNQGYANQTAAANANNSQKAGNLQAGANAAGTMAMKSSRTFKHDAAPAEPVLERIRVMPIQTWRYTRDIDPRQELHIGPFAEDWKTLTGLGDGKEISVIDYCGVLLKCIQELSDEVAQLKSGVK